MSSVRVVTPHGLPIPEAQKRLAGFEAILAKYKVKLAWSGARAAIQGIGVSGSVAVEPTQVVVDVQLGLLARAAGIDASRLQESIRKRLTEAYSA